MLQRWLTMAVLRAAVLRGVAFACFWLILIGAGPADLAGGVVAVMAATWTSLHLLPPGRWRLSLVDVMRLALSFPYQSVVAGIDVARRALDPRLPLHPGFVTYPVGFPPGNARNVFATLTSLLPGTVPISGDEGPLVYHCLDVTQPVASQLAAEEALLLRACRDD
jgi:multicomponent Na+:H+ antiporter subunit E